MRVMAGEQLWSSVQAAMDRLRVHELRGVSVQHLSSSFLDAVERAGEPLLTGLDAAHSLHSQSLHSFTLSVVFSFAALSVTCTH